MGKRYLTQVDNFAGEIPAKVLFTDPLTGGFLGTFPTQGSSFPRLHALSGVCMGAF